MSISDLEWALNELRNSRYEIFRSQKAFILLQIGLINTEILNLSDSLPKFA